MSPSPAGLHPLQILCALALVVVLAGCVAVPGTDGTGTELEERITDAQPPTEIAATLEVRSQVDGEMTRYEDEVWFRGDGTSRIETHDGDLVVTDGETRWHHDREDDSVRTIELDPEAPSTLDGLYAQQERYLTAEEYVLTDVDETSIEDRDAYHLTYDPPEGETVDRSIDVLVGDTEYVLALETSERDVDDRRVDEVQVWLDRETLFPVRHRVSGDGVELETTYRDLVIEPGLEDDLFEPPSASDAESDDGEVEIELPSIDHFESVDRANASVPFAVAEPDPESIPDGLEADGISRYEFPDENRTQVSLFYRGEAGTVSVTTSDGPRSFATEGDPIDLGDESGSIESTDEGTELQWSCEDRYYSVFVSDGLEENVALEIADSIGC
ncbi:LolA family protein [Natrarchaeobius chitinivorans]|uniref:Outer membrane lipoprotein carrier protein LolA n=1 Tax=Natrarchaeobius chitinivorans TaxID=1679083 RepID=A0A3N6P2U3_NATCH|nr:outer membrane lipoprotein carrier protein LolA [Natrarchaeobius chitinivorans]RQG91939.1 outer membrane lipoprotein carrier protein LolA [Natrarchaeobius chitinivorans]